MCGLCLLKSEQNCDSGGGKSLISRVPHILCQAQPGKKWLVDLEKSSDHLTDESSHKLMDYQGLCGRSC